GGVVGSGWVGVVGRSVSIRRRSVGGTTRPGAGLGAAGGGAGGAAAIGAAAGGGAGGSSTGGVFSMCAFGAGGGVVSVFSPRVATWVGWRRSTTGGSSMRAAG